MSRSKKLSPPTMWEAAEEVPRAGIPSTERLARRMRWGRVLVWVVLFTFPVMGIALLATASSLKAANAQEGPVTAVDTVARAVAINAVTDWLATTPSPLPGGTLVSWDSSTDLPAYVAKPSDTEQDAASAARLSEHSLTLRDGTGSSFIAQVLVASNNVGETTALGTPSLMPVAPDSGWAASTSPWPNLNRTTASASVTSAVSAWVSAFASGDPAALRLTVGDPDTDHAYVPMTGVVSATGEEGSAAWVLDASGAKTTSMLVQVEVTFTWPSTIVKSSTNAGPAAATYDLLVTGAASGAPRVVAWGGSGTGPVLTQYMNAVVGRQLVAGTKAVATPEPTATTSTTTGD